MENKTGLLCDFCGKQFKNKSSLNHHIKTAKFCLSIQNKEIIIAEFKCNFCKCVLKNKRNLQTHIMICKEKDIYDAKTKLSIQHMEEMRVLKEKHTEEINEYKIIIASLEAKIDIYEKDHNVISDIAKQTKITNTNNIVNNLAVYDINKITEQFSNKLDCITKEDIINGQKGIANILAPCLYDENGNKMLTCTDKSRLIFTKLDDKNNRIKDSELKNLASVIKPLALKKADEIVEEHNKLKEKINNIDILKEEIKDNKSYIKHFQDIIDNYRNSNINSKLVIEYEKNIKKYEENITRNQEIIDNNEYDLDSEYIEDENEKLIDGHIEIQYLDKETAKFARQMAKIF